jgi:hypothetical protein
MREFGYIEGKNFVMEWRFADGKYERFPELAAELVNQTDAAGHDRSGSDCDPSVSIDCRGTAGMVRKQP